MKSVKRLPFLISSGNRGFIDLVICVHNITYDLKKLSSSICHYNILNLLGSRFL